MVVTLMILPILILAAAVVGMEDKIGLSQTVMIEVVMEEGNNTITPLPTFIPSSMR